MPRRFFFEYSSSIRRLFVGKFFAMCRWALRNIAFASRKNCNWQEKVQSNAEKPAFLSRGEQLYFPTWIQFHSWIWCRNFPAFRNCNSCKRPLIATVNNRKDKTRLSVSCDANLRKKGGQNVTESSSIFPHILMSEKSFIFCSSKKSQNTKAKGSDQTLKKPWYTLSCENIKRKKKYCHDLTLTYLYSLA